MISIWAEDLYNVVKKYKPKKIVEIGCANGGVSTKAILDAIQESGYTPEVFYGFEYNTELYNQLIKKSSAQWFKPLKSSTTKLNNWMTIFDIVMFYKENNVRNRPHIDLVIQWYLKSVNHLINNPEIHSNKLEEIKELHQVFDLVLIDGGPFSGESEYNLVKDSKIIILDDIHDIKCNKIYNDLLKRSEYKLELINDNFNNGYCIFVRK